MSGEPLSRRAVRAAGRHAHAKRWGHCSTNNRPRCRCSPHCRGASLARFSPRPPGELVGSCLPLRTGEKRPCATVLPLSASAWVIRTPVKHRLGRRVPRTLVAKQRRCRLDLAPGRFSAFVVPVLRGRPDPTSSPNTGAAQRSLEGLTHRAIAVSVAASGPLARRRQCLAVARQISPRAEAGRKAGGAIPRVAFGPCDPPSCE